TSSCTPPSPLRTASAKSSRCSHPSTRRVQRSHQRAGPVHAHGRRGGPPEGNEDWPMKKLLLTAFVLSALLSAWGCHNHDRNQSTGRGERQDRLDTTSGRMPER